MKSILLFMLLVCLDVAQAQKAQVVLRPTITVSDLDKVLPFFTQTLPFRLLGINEVPTSVLTPLFGIRGSGITARIATLELGEETLDLLDFGQPDTGAPIPADSRSNDRWFQHVAIVVSDIDSAYHYLRQQKVAHISSSPQTLPGYLPAAAGIRAFYFRDPDGHALELIWFPAGKGAPKWHQPGGGLFRGLDHTAIGTADTDRSLAFYHDLLGMHIGGKSENYGSEQEHLNQVFGAHLLITGLTTGQGIGIELLDYLAPPSGRPYPVSSSHVNDHWHWHTIVQVSRIDQLYGRIREQNVPVISAGVVPIQYPGLLAKRGLLIRDPDGHALLLCE